MFSGARRSPRRKVLEIPAQTFNGSERLLGLYKGLQISQLKSFFFIGNVGDFMSFAN